MFKWLILIALLASPFSSAQSEADILSLRPTGFRPAPLTGETTLEYLSLIREISRNTHQRLAELDYLLTGNLIVPRSLIPSVHDLALPAFTRLDYLTDKDVHEFADHLNGYGDLALMPLVNVLQASSQVLSRAYADRHQNVAGFRDLPLDQLDKLDKTLTALKALTDKMAAVKTGVDALKIRALAFLDRQQDEGKTIGLSYPDFLHEVRIDLFEPRLHQAQNAWADLQRDLNEWKGRDRLISLRRFVDVKERIDEPSTARLGGLYLVETNKLLRQVRQAAEAADAVIQNRFPEHSNVVSLFPPDTEAGQRTAQVKIEDIMPKFHALHAKMQKLFELARDLRALYLEDPQSFGPKAFPRLSEIQREEALAQFEVAARALLQSLSFLAADPQTLSRIWRDNKGLEQYVSKQWPSWQRSRLQAQKALTQLNPQVRTAALIRGGCEALLLEEPEMSPSQ